MKFFKNFFENILKKKDRCLSYIDNDQKIKTFIEKIKYYIIKVKKNKYIKKLNKKMIIMPLIIISIFFLGSFIGDITHKEDVFIKKIERALEKGSSRTILKLVRSQDGLELTKSDIKPLIEFYKEENSRIKTLITALRKNQGAYSLKLCKDDKTDEYYLDMELKNMEITSNFEGSSVYVNGTLKGEINENGKLVVSNLVPGLYNIKIENKSDYGNIKEDTDVLLINDSNISMPLNATLITVNSNFQEGTVYINGKNSNIKVKDFVDIGPFNKDEITTVMVKVDTPWGVLSSNEYIIGEHPMIELKVNLKDNKVLDEVNDTMNRFYFSVFKSLNSENKDDIVNATEEVKGNIYSILNKEYFWLKNNYEVSDLDIKINNSEINFDGSNYIGNIVVTISYKIKKQIFGISIKNEEYVENFFTEIKYDDGKWIVYNISNFSLEGLESIAQ